MDAVLIAACFAKLAKAIDMVNTFTRDFGYVSPWHDEDGNEIPSPVADDFMLMEPPRADGTLAFKHSRTRNYVFVKPSGELAIPRTAEPFLRGYF